MTVRIPSFHSDSTKTETLRNCVVEAAEQTGLDTYEVALAMTHFFERLAHEVSRGRTVSIPGFGLFAPTLAKRHHHGPHPYCRPAFSPSNGFRQQVRYDCPPVESGSVEYRAHQKNHCRETSPHRRVFTAMRTVRETLAAQYAGVK